MMKKDSGLPRGIRNNNPGNIRENARTNDDWDGESIVDNDADFEVFDSPEYGIRAIGKILNSYERRGIVTIAQIINTWAPDIENNTKSYIAAVEKETGYRGDSIPGRLYRPELVKAIIKHENGIQPYSDELIKRGLSLA